MWIVLPDVNIFLSPKGRRFSMGSKCFMEMLILCEGVLKTTITPVVVARGSRERSNPAKTTTALRDGS